MNFFYFARPLISARICALSFIVTLFPSACSFSAHCKCHPVLRAGALTSAAASSVDELSTTIGKVVRINPDGTVPSDNPFVRRQGARPEIWSYGHRNLQGAALHPESGELWTLEHGARGGDELNHPEAGKNYGWPVSTYGREYSGFKIGDGITAKAGMEQPVYYWDPVIAPSGAEFYTGAAFPEWQGDLFVGSLSPGALVRLELNGYKVTSETRYLGDINERIRHVRQGADGFLYLLTDSPQGRVLRVEPAAKSS